MSFITKIKKRIADGSLREIISETRWIYRHTRAYRKAIINFILLGLLTNVLSLLLALASKELINSIVFVGTNGHGGMHIAYYGIAMAFFAVGQVVFTAWVSRYSTKVNLRINNELRAEVYSGFLGTEWSELQHYHSGDLLSRVNTDTTNVANSVLGWLPTLIVRSVQFLTSLLVILIYDPTMALIALLTAPVSLVVAKPFASKMRAASKDMRAISSDMVAFHEETLQNAQPIKAMNLVDAFRAKQTAVQQLYYETADRFSRFSVFSSAFLSVVGLVVNYLCLGWGAYRLWLGKIDFGTMVLFIQLAGYLSSSLSALIKLVPSAIECTVSAQRIMTILSLPREDYSNADAVSSMDPQNFSLELHSLSFSYHVGKPVLQNVTLTVAPQEMIALIGSSGSGKTTLFRLLLALLHPSDGRLCLVSNGEEFDISPATRSLFSYVPQENVIFSGSIAEMLRMVRPNATDAEIYDALRIACADEFVSALPDGIHSPLHECGRSLSLGQNQRLSIARAVLADAPIMLLDEVTSALDLDTEERVLQNIAALPNKTCIISTHRPSVLSLCDRVYRIKKTHLEPVLPEDLEKMLHRSADERKKQ